MKLSFSTNAFTRFAVSEAVAKIASMGYDGVEILADMPHFFADRIDEKELQQVQEIIRRDCINVANINANTAVGYYQGDFWEPLFEPSLANPDRVARKWRIDYTKRAIDLAVALASPCVSVTSGRLVPGCDPGQSLDFLKDSLLQVLQYAEKQGVLIAIEYEPGLLIECCAELMSFLAEMNSPALGANLDLGHSFLAGEDVAQVITSLDDKIFHVHLEDIRDKKHFHLIPGLGTINFQQLLPVLAENYDGFVSVELYTYPQAPEEAGRRAKDYLDQFPVWQSTQ